VAFQGELGAFSELAVRMRWPDSVPLVPCRTFGDTVHVLLAGRADFAVIPVENAIAGVVVAARAALDAAGDQLQYLGEVLVPVHLCLMAPAGASLADLRRVDSHQMALAQCQRFLAQHPLLVARVHDDTAGAARDVAARANVTHAAIAAEAAASRYGLEILARDIQDVSNNWTRFVVVQRSPTSVVITTPTTTAGREFRE
jgi:prephenate dehydratase